MRRSRNVKLPRDWEWTSGKISVENWNTERVREELKKRDVVYVNRDGQREPRPDMTGTLESFHVPDAMGWDLQIGNKIAPSRS